MKKLLVAGAALSLLGGAVAPAFAQNREIRQDRRELRQDRRELRQDRRWARGQRLPRAYYADQRYYVNDWRARRLPPPRRGYRWVRRDNDYLMVAATTGLIASVIAASR
jgi:Ni/Co efflux regulator RcnB